MIALLGRRRGRILMLLVGNGMCQAGAAIGAALAVELAFARLQDPSPVTLGQIALVAAALVAAAGATAGLRWRERVDAERLGQSYVHDLRMHLFDHLTSMSSRAISPRSQGSTALRFVGDLGAIRKWVSLGLSRLCVAGTMVTATLVALTLVDVRLALATGAAAAVGSVGAIAQGPRLRDASRTARRSSSRLAGRVSEIIGSVAVVQANNAVDRERRRVGSHSRRTRDAMVERARRIARLHAVAEATGSGATAMLLIAALTFGIAAPQVAAGMTVVALLVPQLRGLARVQEYRQQERVAVEALERFVDRPPMLSEPRRPLHLAAGPGRLELIEASFAPIHGVSAVARAGRTVAVVGPNGAGKTTLFSMIGRLVDIDHGTILLDGTDLAAVSLADAHGAIGMAGPDLPLMNGSVRRNLTYRHRDASTEDIDRAIERCGLADLLDALPDGLDTRIDEGGTNLSSGQRQRLLLARAMIARPRVLLLDEADANLDAATTRVLDAVLDDHDGSALVITHRLDRVLRADDVWHLDAGELVESGTPAEVLAPGRPTHRLFGAELAPSVVGARAASSHGG